MRKTGGWSSTDRLGSPRSRRYDATALADTRSSGRRHDALENPELLRREGGEKAANIYNY